MADTSSKIKIGAFFNNALAIAILCKYKKQINQSFHKLYLPLYTISEVTHVVRGVSGIMQFKLWKSCLGIPVVDHH
jgi:hypothetical protein